jgi:hypothetical protein
VLKICKSEANEHSISHAAVGSAGMKVLTSSCSRKSAVLNMKLFKSFIVGGMVTPQCGARGSTGSESSVGRLGPLLAGIHMLTDFITLSDASAPGYSTPIQLVLFLPFINWGYWESARKERESCNR